MGCYIIDGEGEGRPRRWLPPRLYTLTFQRGGTDHEKSTLGTAPPSYTNLLSPIGIMPNPDPSMRICRRSIVSLINAQPTDIMWAELNRLHERSLAAAKLVSLINAQPTDIMWAELNRLHERSLAAAKWQGEIERAWLPCRL